MGLKIKAEENINRGVYRILTEECRKALKYLEDADDVHEKIHEARKSFKKSRAVHRLIRDASDFYKRENVFYRDLGRKVSELRDATSVIEILNVLKDKYSDELYKNTFDSVHESLLIRREKMAERQFEDSDPLNQIKQQLKAKCTEIPDLDIVVQTFEDIAPSIQRVYRRGYKTYRSARKSPTSENLHEWRKRAKYLRYQVKMLKEIWKPIYKELEDELHDLTDYLGDDHDLENLKQVLDTYPINYQDKSEPSLLLGLIEQSQKELKEKALLLGKKIFALPPDVFVDQMNAAWKSHKKETAS